MRDREVVAAIRAGEPVGLAAAYDGYAAALYAYCRSLLTESGPATDAVQSTFLTAIAKLEYLQDPDRLRSWLFAIARNECHRRLRDHAAGIQLAGSGNVVAALADVLADADRSEPPDLVSAAIAGLHPSERDVIELTLYRDLDGADLAALLGMSHDQVQSLAAQARTRFEDALGTLLISRAGREFCPGMDALLAAWDTGHAAAMHTALGEHLDHCPTCGDRGSARRTAPAPRPQVTAAGERQPASGLDGKGIGGTWPASGLDGKPGGGAVPGLDASAGAQAASGGTARQLAPPARRRVRLPDRVPGRWVRAVTAGAAAVAVLTAGTLYWTKMPRYRQGAQPASSVPVLGIQAPTWPGGRHAPGVPSAPAVAHITTPTANPMRASTAPAPTAFPSTHPASPAPPVPGTLTASPTTVTLHPGGAGEPPAGSFALTANGGPVASFTITVPAADAGILTVTPTGGSLTAWSTAHISVTLQPGYHGRVDAQLTVDPGGLAVVVVYRPRLPHGSHMPA